MKVKTFSSQSNNIEQKASVPEVALNNLLLLTSTGRSRQLTQKQILENYHKSPPLHMAVSAIARDISQINFSLDPPPANFNLSQPNKYHSGCDLFSMIAKYLKLTGECYLLKTEGVQGKSLLPIPSYMVDQISKDEFQITETLFDKDVFQREELVVFRESSLVEPYDQGRGEGEAVGTEIDISEASSEYIANYFENNARPDTLVSIGNASEDEVRAFKESINNKHRGPGNAGKTAAFQDADIDVQTLSQEFGDLGIDEIREYSAKVIRSIYSIPPSIVGLGDSRSRESAETDNYVFKKNIIKPLVRKITEVLNTQYFEKELNTTLKYGDIIPPNKKHIIELVKAKPDLLTDEELRNLIGIQKGEE